MHELTTAIPSVTLDAYIGYLQGIVSENRDNVHTFDADRCGAFIQDNYPLVVAASFERMRQLIDTHASFTLGSESSDTEEVSRAVYEINPRSEKNPVYLQLFGRAIPDFEHWCPDVDPSTFCTSLSFHGGGSNGENRSYELLCSIVEVLQICQRERIGCVVPFCHLENRKHKLIG